MQTAKANGIEGAHRLRSRSRMVASNPSRIAASQRSIALRGHISHASSVSRLKDGRLLDNSQLRSSLDRNTWRPSTATPSPASRLRDARTPSQRLLPRRSPAPETPSTALSAATGPKPLFEMLGGLLKLLDDVDALRAHGLAGTALDAVARTPRCRLPAILLLGELGVLRLDLQVQ